MYVRASLHCRPACSRFLLRDAGKQETDTLAVISTKIDLFVSYLGQYAMVF